MADAQPPADEDNDQAKIDEEIARLETQERHAIALQRQARLRDRASRGFPVDDDVGSESYKQRLTLERAKSARSPELYSGENQRALDDFFNQLDLVFQTKPLTYSADKDKCVYAAGYLSGIPSQEWNAEARRIDANPDLTYSYREFKEFLQERRLPAHIRTANLTVKISDVRQRPNQSVPQLIAYLNELENQVDPPYSDRTRRDHLFVAIHEQPT